MCDIRQDSSSKIKALFYYLEAHFQRSERVNNDTLLCDLSQSDDKIDRNASARESKIEMYWSEKSDIDLI